MSDLIDRQAALDIIKNYYDGVADPFVAGTICYDKIKQLPSVQPDLQPTCNQLATDCIDRQAAIAEFSCCELTPDGGIDVNYAIDFLEQMPTAQPDIIRCKDCEYYELTEWVAHRCNLLGRSVYGNDFCAWAEPYKGEK